MGILSYTYPLCYFVSVVPWSVFGDIYDVLLSMPELKSKNPKLDAEGRNLLHTVCIESQTLLENEHVGSSFGLLLTLSDHFDWKLDPKLRDKHNKMPLDYCIPGSLTHKFFNLILEKSKGIKLLFLLSVFSIFLFNMFIVWVETIRGMAQNVICSFVPTVSS